MWYEIGKYHFRIIFVCVCKYLYSGVSESMITFFFFLVKDADLLDIESKHFEDLEFQQLEHESRLDEEKENLTQQLLREVAEYQRSIVNRKVKAVKLN